MRIVECFIALRTPQDITESITVLFHVFSSDYGMDIMEFRADPNSCLNGVGS